MLIIGIDPGTAITGFGIVELQGKNLKRIEAGIIETAANSDPAERLVIICKAVRKIIKKFKPQIAAIEDIFFFRNSRSVIAVAQSRGAVMQTLAREKIKVFSYTPLQIKQTLTGYGRASKGEVQSAVRKALRIQKLPRPDHAADALAAAICYVKKTSPLFKIKL